MDIKRFTLGPVLTNLYVVSEDSHGFIVDAVEESNEVCDYIEKNNIKIDFILQTHTHFDHVLGLDFYRKKYNTKVFAASESREIANDKRYNLAFDYPNLYVPIDYYLEDGQIITDFEIKVMKTPGHSLDSTSYVLRNVLFSGDTLFNMSIGRTDFPGGDFSTIIESIKHKYSNLDKKMIVYPGHGNETTLENEFINNPFLN